MAMFLESQIGLFEREVLARDPSEVEDLIAFHLMALERPETHLSSGGLSEADRPLVPLFQRWLAAAGNVKEIAGNLRNAGETVSGYDDLLRAMNRSKPIADSFDYFVKLNCHLAATKNSSNGG